MLSTWEGAEPIYMSPVLWSRVRKPESTGGILLVYSNNALEPIEKGTMKSLPAGGLLIGHLAWVRGKRPVGLRALLPGIRHFILQIGMMKKKIRFFLAERGRFPWQPLPVDQVQELTMALSYAQGLPKSASWLYLYSAAFWEPEIVIWVCSLPLEQKRTRRQ